MNEVSQRFYIPTSAQKFAALGAVSMSLVAVIITVVWASGSAESGGNFLGGVNWKKHIFNWHPILMVGGFIFCYTNSLVSFRIMPYSKSITKPLHAAWHTATLVCVGLGLFAVFQSHNNPEKHAGGGYYANLYSLHSWLGIAAVTLYLQNYVLGFAYFLFPSWASVQARKLYMPTHISLGTFTFAAGTMAVVTGIMEWQAWNSCKYSVTEPDTNPALHYSLLSTGCRLSGGLGIVALLTCLLVCYALMDTHVTSSALSASANQPSGGYYAGETKPLLSTDIDITSDGMIESAAAISSIRSSKAAQRESHSYHDL